MDTFRCSKIFLLNTKNRDRFSIRSFYLIIRHIKYTFYFTLFNRFVLTSQFYKNHPFFIFIDNMYLRYPFSRLYVNKKFSELSDMPFVVQISDTKSSNLDSQPKLNCTLILYFIKSKQYLLIYIKPFVKISVKRGFDFEYISIQILYNF